MHRESLLAKVQARLTLLARKPSADALEGEHGSIHRGRSMDFDDLREYTLGDDVKDIDWKATARAGRPLIKRYVATRRHAVMLVVDTGRTMAALATPDDCKRDVAVLTAGAIAQIAMAHGDSVGLVAGPIARGIDLGGSRLDRAGRTAFVPPLRGDVHLERILRLIHDGIDLDGDLPDLDRLLGYVTSHFQRRLILVIVADDVDLTPRTEQLLRGLATRHEILHCAVADALITEPALAGSAMRTVEHGRDVPAYFRARTDTHDRVVAELRALDDERRGRLARSAIPSIRIVGEADVVPSVVTLLERQRLFGLRQR